jgi:hypothetical protein
VGIAHHVAQMAGKCPPYINCVSAGCDYFGELNDELGALNNTRGSPGSRTSRSQPIKDARNVTANRIPINLTHASR